MKRYSLRLMLVCVTLIAVVLAIYCSIKRDVPRAKIAIMQFSAPAMHSALVEQLDKNVYIPIDRPDLPIDQPLAKLEHRSWNSDRSDWFVVKNEDAENYVHFASSSDGQFVVNVWATNKILYHQDPVTAVANTPEELLSFRLITELSSKVLPAK